MNLKNLLKGAVLTLSALALGACGGGGSSLAALTRNPLTVFASDDLNTGYDHVWVTVDKVDLLNGSNVTNVVDYSASGGLVVDLRTLRDSTGARFMLLGSKGVTAGSYTGMNVTLKKDLTIVTTGASTGTAATFANAGPTEAVLSLVFPTPQSVGLGSHLDIDFDLAHWTLAGGVVSADNGQFLAFGDTSTLGDESRHEKRDFEGVVSALTGTAPNQTFTLTDGPVTLAVDTTAATSVYNGGGSPNPTLVEGGHVHVAGTYNTTTQMFDASSVEIQVHAENHLQHAKGLVTASDLTAQTLTVKVDEAEDFLPDGASLSVVENGQTVFLDASGLTLTEAQFYGKLTADSRVAAKGTVSGGVLTASLVRLEEGSGNDGSGEGGDHSGSDTTHWAHFEGTFGAVDAQAHTLNLTVNVWEGANLQQGAVVPVVFDPNANFRVNSVFTDLAGYFTALAGGGTFKATGSYDTGTGVFTAHEVFLVTP